MALGIDYNSGIPHTNGAPTHDPGTNGGKLAYDHVNRVKYKWVSGTTWEVDASGGGGGDSLGTGFTSGGGAGSIPIDTFVDVASVMRFQGAGLVAFDCSSVFTSAPAFETSINVYYDLSVDGVINTTSIGNPGANGKTGVTFDDTENMERLSFFINDVEKVGIETNGTLDMKTTAGALIPPRLTESERDALTPSEGWTIYCTDATANDASTGVMQTYNGSTWKNHW